MQRTLACCLMVALAGCGDDTSNSNNPDGPVTDAPADARVDAPVDAPATMDGPADAMPLFGIAGVRAAADANPTGGAVSIDVTDVLVTFSKPAIGTEPAGFFVQDQAAGPAVFIAVDPATLSPAATVGDRVSFTVTMVAKLTGVREATAIGNYVRSSAGNDVSGLVADVSSAADLVSNLDAYESRLIHLTGTLAANFASAGTGFTSAQITTAGLTSTNLKLRLPQAVQTSLDLASACALTVNTGVMWRFNAQAQPSTFQASDLSVTSCPAPRVVSAVPSNSTTVEVNFDRLIDSASVATDGSQFTIDNGLGVSAAQVLGKTVTLTTAAQTGGTSYTVTVAQTVTDTRGTALDAAATTAMFSGYVQLATLLLNEIAPNIAGSADLIELRAIAGGSINNMTVGQALSNPQTLATLPNVTVAAGDLIVVHLTPPVGVTTETNSQTECADAACLGGAWDVRGGTTGVAFSNRVVWIKNPDGSLQDAVPFVSTTVSNPPSAYPGDLQTLQSMGLWNPADCNGSPCTYTSTPTAQAVSADWTAANASTLTNTVQRQATNKNASDWHVVTQTIGAANP